MKIQHVFSLPEVGVSHNPDIKKKVIIEKGFIPNITTFGQARFKPGQSVENHSHETMFEVFYIQEGKIIFVVDGEEVELKKGDSITIEPGEMHLQDNRSKEDVVFLYFGVAV